MNNKIIIGTLIGCFFGATVGYSASIVSLPHTFTAGTSIRASEVNANFSALAQEIAHTKDSIGLNKSSDFVEMAITPISVSVGSTIVVDSKSFIIKQMSDIEDPITGKKYTLKYPSPTGGVGVGLGFSVSPSNCKGLIDTELVVKVGKGNGFVSYVYYGSYSGAETSAFTGNRVQITDNLCASIGGDTGNGSHIVAIEMINRATELQKYISVQAI